MKPNVLTLVKLGISIVSIGISIATSIIAKKELDVAVTEKVAEALAKSTKVEP